MIHFPTLNASLNALSAFFLLLGFVFIKNRNIFAHKLSMSAAFVSSTTFLACYLYYHYNVGSTSFQGQGFIRTVYFTILISHTILATAVVPLALITLYHAWRNTFEKHARLARWTWPIWMYVSVTGVVIYWMLYRL